LNNNMMDKVLNKWKDVSPEDITSEPNWEKGWELVHADVVKVHGESVLNIFVNMLKISTSSYTSLMAL